MQAAPLARYPAKPGAGRFDRDIKSSDRYRRSFRNVRVARTRRRELAGTSPLLHIAAECGAERVGRQDRQDSANLYQTLTEEIIPSFFDRDAHGVPRQWIQKIRRAMVTLVPQFNTWRMVQEYTRKYYLAK